jgi:membrane fusion protein (multidrug efflux system)
MHEILRGPRRTAAIVVAGLAAIFAAGCREKPVSATQGPAPMVGVVESRRMTVPVVVTPIGTTQALEDVTIRARVRGFLTERHFEEGAFVRKGDLLLVIDEEPFRVELESARARLSEAEAALRKAEESKAREVADAQLALSRSQLLLAQIRSRRMVELLNRNAVSSSEVDEVTAEHKKWEAQVEADRASLDQSRADFHVGVDAARAKVKVAQAAVREAELNLGYCRMSAPIDGRIGEAKVKVGNLVGPEATGGGALSDLATIHQLDPIGVDVRLSSRDLDRIRGLVQSGLTVQVLRPGPEGDVAHAEAGSIYFIDNAVDELTSMFLAKARVPNPGGVLLPGEYVKVRMEIGRLVDTVVVPTPAVLETDAGSVVYVVDAKGKVAERQVTAGLTHDGLRVISKGLDPGVPVIVEGLQSVRPGLAVQTERSVLAARYEAAQRNAAIAEASLPVRPADEGAVAALPRFDTDRGN